MVTAGGTVALINSGLLKLPEIRRRDVWKLGASGLILISNELEIVRCFGVSAAEKLYYVILPLLVKSLTLLELMTFGSLFFFCCHTFKNKSDPEFCHSCLHADFQNLHPNSYIFS